MAEFKGSSLVVEFGALTLSDQARTVSVNEEAGDPEEIDITHRGDSVRTVLEGFPGRVATKVETDGLDEGGGTAKIYDTLMNAVDTLLIYLEGKTAAGVLTKVTVQNARLIARSQETTYDGATSWKASFSAKNSVTWGTYSS